MRFLLSVCFVLTLLSPPGYAQCDCLWQGSFSDVQADSDLVVSGTVVATKGNSIDLAIAHSLRNDEVPEDVRVWLKSKHYCRPDVELFPVGTQWVMALDAITETIPGGFDPNTPNISYGRIGDYSLSICGGYWLRQNGNFVTGNLVNAPRWERAPQMTPVLLDLVVNFVQGKLNQDSLLQASKEDPALRALMLDTRAFLRSNR